MPHPIDTSLEYGEPDEYFRHHDESGKVANFSAILSEAERIAGQKGRLLDVGCGRGEALVAARDTGWTPVGVDTSEQFVTYAREHYGVDARLGDLRSMRFPDASFTAVLLSAVLEHVFDPWPFFARSAECLIRVALSTFRSPMSRASSSGSATST